jgi:uncharacterized protein YceK
MRKFVIVFASVGLLLLSGCEGSMGTKGDDEDAAPVAAAAKGGVVTDEAKQALSKAQADVKAAKAKEALWIPAADALKKAEAAADNGDSGAAIKNAKVASEFSAMGIEQLKYPATH